MSPDPLVFRLAIVDIIIRVVWQKKRLRNLPFDSSALHVDFVGRFNFAGRWCSESVPAITSFTILRL
jgi:hypothetical protein